MSEEQRDLLLQVDALFKQAKGILAAKSLTHEQVGD